MASNEASLDVLKKAFNEGFEAFSKVVQNEKGFYNNPSNTYPPKGLPYKEWQRGFNRAFIEQQQANKKAGI